MTQEHDTAFRDFAKSHRAAVDAHLAAFFDEQRRASEGVSPRAAELINAVASLTMRGGKRVRALIVAAAHLAVDDEAGPAPSVTAGAAMELLQTYLLIHDDWMDGDETRRGGPAVHVMFRDAHDEHTANSLGILAGDLASTYAWQLMLEAPFPRWRRGDGLEAFIALQTEVYFGQQLDIVADPDVERMHQLKTGSYTVRGPMRLGAALGDANPDQSMALESWAHPLGSAFQLRDDILGTYPGDGAGKPGDDLVHGKETALAAAGRERLKGDALVRFEAVFGNTDATGDAVAEVASDLEACGARAAVEEQCMALLATSNAALDGAPLSETGVSLLRGLGRLMAVRTT